MTPTNEKLLEDIREELHAWSTGEGIVEEVVITRSANPPHDSPALPFPVHTSGPHGEHRNGEGKRRGRGKSRRT